MIKDFKAWEVELSVRNESVWGKKNKESGIRKKMELGLRTQGCFGRFAVGGQRGYVKGRERTVSTEGEGRPICEITRQREG